MWFFHENSGEKILEITGELYTYIFKTRRADPKNHLVFCNFSDGFLHFYALKKFIKNASILQHERREKIIQDLAKKHVIWGIIDPKIIEKSLPFLNQLGITKITFFYADFSQKNFKINAARMQKILIASNLQCQRFSLMSYEILPDLTAVFDAYPEAILLDFSGEILPSHLTSSLFIIGPEGGFSERELILAQKRTKIFRPNSPLVLRSETAVIFAANLLNF